MGRTSAPCNTCYIVLHNPRQRVILSHPMIRRTTKRIGHPLCERGFALMNNLRTARRSTVGDRLLRIH